VNKVEYFLIEKMHGKYNVKSLSLFSLQVRRELPLQEKHLLPLSEFESPIFQSVAYSLYGLAITAREVEQISE
jgi:hypothetical protein